VRFIAPQLRNLPNLDLKIITVRALVLKSERFAPARVCCSDCLHPRVAKKVKNENDQRTL
jgi:hypothetical protein